MFKPPSLGGEITLPEKLNNEFNSDLYGKKTFERYGIIATLCRNDRHYAVDVASDLSSSGMILNGAQCIQRI